MKNYITLFTNNLMFKNYFVKKNIFSKLKFPKIDS